MNDGQFICMRTVSPVRLNMLSVCVEWQNDDGKTLDDMDREFPFKFSENRFVYFSKHFSSPP